MKQNSSNKLKKIPVFLLFWLLALFPFGQLTRLPFNTPGINFYLNDLILGLLVISFFIFNQTQIKKPPLFKPVLAFLIISFISLVFNAFRLTREELIIASLYWIRLFFYFGGLYFVIFNLKRQFSSLFLVNCLLIVGVVTAIFGLGQYFFYPDISALEAWGWDPHFYRLVGTFLDPNFSGLIFVLTLILILIFKKKWAFYGLFSLVYLALALTYSRSSYLAWLAAISVTAFFKKSIGLFLIMVFLGCLTLFLLPRQSGGEGVILKRTSTIQSRIKNWQQALIISRDHPFWGVGFNAYRFSQRDYGFLEKNWQTNHAGAGVDSSLLFVLATTGIWGLLSYTYFWLKAINRKNLMILTNISAILVHSLFINSAFYPWILTWLMIILA